jgi:hypothetical protein
MKLDQTLTQPPLPLMKNFDEAQRIAENEKDAFYLAAFLIQCWLGNVTIAAAAEYAEKKVPKDRALQTGESWRGFLELFGGATKKGFRYMLSCLVRFCISEDSSPLRHSLIPLSIEHHCTGDYFGPETLLTAATTEPGNEIARRTLVRWCDWLDAEIHLRTHRRWYVSPAAFASDPEKRELAALGTAQRNLAHMSNRAKVCWVWDFANAAERYKDSPKWAELGKAMSDDSVRLWQYPDVDTLIIALWPLVKAYNWTYRDLLNVIRPGLKRPGAYPCGREQDMAAYCVNVLGLRKTGRGSTAKKGEPRGNDIAKLWVPALGK